MYGFKCVTFWKRQNYRDRERISGCQRVGREGCIDRAHRSFRAVKLLEILYIYRYICKYTFVKVLP